MRSSRSAVISWKLERVSFSSRWMGPDSLMERYCRLMFVEVAEDSSLLGLLGGVLETLHGDLVLGQVHAVLALDLLDQPVDDAGVPVVTAQAVSPLVART